jgi:cbb3-type cytochrome oxidase subunit 3
MSIFALKYFIMFSRPQMLFALLFFICFVIAISYSYRKDKLVHDRIYKGNYKILIGFIVFIGLLFLIRVFLKH